VIPSRFVGRDAARARFGARVDRLATFLSECDPLADAVVLALAALPPGEGFRLFSECAAKGVDAVPLAPDALRAFFHETEQTPAWFDPVRAERGRRVFLRYGPLAGIVLGGRSLILGYVSPAGNKPLVFSGRLAAQAPRRLAETGRFVQAIAEPHGTDVGAEGYQITLKVRIMHAQVRRMIELSGKWRPAEWGRPINQHDMAGTTLLFSLAVIDGLRSLGARIDRQEADDYVHLWRVIGRLMGVSAELLPACEADAIALAEVIAATQAPPDDDARALTSALLRVPHEEATTPIERLLARPRAALGGAVTRHLLGAELADELGVPSTPLSAALPLLRGVTRARELVHAIAPGRRERAVDAGLAYWRGVVARALRGRPTGFQPPEGLRGVPRPGPA